MAFGESERVHCSTGREETVQDYTLVFHSRARLCHSSPQSNKHMSLLISSALLRVFFSFSFELLPVSVNATLYHISSKCCEKNIFTEKKREKKAWPGRNYSALSVEFRAAACLIMTGGGAANFRDIILLNL